MGTEAQLAREYDRFTSQWCVGNAIPLAGRRCPGSGMGDWNGVTPRNRESIKKSISVETQHLHGSEQHMSSGLGIVSRVVMIP